MKATSMMRGLSMVVAVGCVAALVRAVRPQQAHQRAHQRGPWRSPGCEDLLPREPHPVRQVGVIKIGPSSAKNVLVLEPGTSAGSAYFVPLAQWIVSKTSGWQVWSVERRENLLEDQSELNLSKEGKATATQLFDYYLGYLKNPSIKHHFQISRAPASSSRSNGE